MCASHSIPNLPLSLHMSFEMSQIKILQVLMSENQYLSLCQGPAGTQGARSQQTGGGLQQSGVVLSIAEQAAQMAARRGKAPALQTDTTQSNITVSFCESSIGHLAFMHERPCMEVQQYSPIDRNFHDLTDTSCILQPKEIDRRVHNKSTTKHTA